MTRSLPRTAGRWRRSAMPLPRRSARHFGPDPGTGCMEGMLIDVVIFLAAALVAVPLSIRLGFGSVLGYLLAGVVIGPWVLRLITDVDAILHFAELGIVLMMFVIGLEMQVEKLWAMRRTIFGYGGAQMALCALVLMATFLVFGSPWRV